MKILFIVDSFSGGAGNVIQILAREFTDRGYKCTIALFNGKNVEPKYDMSGIDIIDHKLDEYVKISNHVSNFINYIKEVKKIIKSVNPNVIVSFLTQFNIFSTIANNKKKILIISERINPFVNILPLYWRILRRFTYRKADMTVVQCKFFENFCNGAFKDKITTIPNPILVPPILHEPKKDNEKIRFVSMGRLVEQKQFFWMLDRMKEIHKKAPNTELKIYGSGGLNNSLEQYIINNNMQNFASLGGYINDPYPILADSDIYLMTSDNEGFPNALSEAMAVGLPSVSRKCHDGISDLVMDGVNGFLVDFDDIEGFVERSVELALNPDLRKAVSDEAKKVSDTYGVKKITDRWQVLIEQFM